MNRRFYHVTMEFKQCLTFRMMIEIFGIDSQHTTFENTLTIKGTFPEFPNEEYIKKLEKIYKDEFNKKDSEFYVLSCKFDCFKEVKVIDEPTNE